MSDHDDTEDFSTPTSDRFADAIALCNLVANAKSIKTRVRALARLNHQIADANTKLAAAETKATELVAKAESDVAAIHDDAQQRLLAVESAKQDLRERERRIQILEAAWRGLGEGPDVWSGLRSPEYSPLQKARMAAGREPGKDPDIYGFSQPDAAPAVRIDALSDTSDDPHADRQGAPFVGELTRDVSHHKRRGAA